MSWAKGLSGGSLEAGVPLAVSVGRRAVSSPLPREKDAALQKTLSGELWDCPEACGVL